MNIKQKAREIALRAFETPGVDADDWSAVERWVTETVERMRIPGEDFGQGKFRAALLEEALARAQEEIARRLVSAEELEEDPLTIAEFIATYGITMDWSSWHSNPYMTGPHAQTMRHYVVRLRYGEREASFPFSMGSATTGDPDIESVLYCIAGEAASFENADSFLSWAKELGYDPYDPNAEKIYRACARHVDALKQLLGDELYEKLLWNTDY